MPEFQAPFSVHLLPAHALVPGLSHSQGRDKAEISIKSVTKSSQFFQEIWYSQPRVTGGQVGDQWAGEGCTKGEDGAQKRKNWEARWLAQGMWLGERHKDFQRAHFRTIAFRGVSDDALYKCI